MRIPDHILKFFHNQEIVIVSTLDAKGKIHCAVKGIVGIEENGKVYLIDLYLRHTFANLKNNPVMSITALDEDMFKGYTLKGKGLIVERKNIAAHIVQKWEERLIRRISKRVIKNIKKSVKARYHPEAAFPRPQYLIEMVVQKIVNLAPVSV